MAKKSREPEPPGSPQISPQQAIDLLQRQIEKGEVILHRRPIAKDEHSSWELVTGNLLEKAFGKTSPNVTAVTSVGKYGGFPGHASDAWWDNHRAESLQTQLRKLAGLIELLRTEVELRDEGVVKQEQSPTGCRIFLVHGHDELALQETARFLEKLERDVIILREQPNLGRTLIEKFEEYADVGFAIVLLTPDDRGVRRAWRTMNKGPALARMFSSSSGTSSAVSDATGFVPCTGRVSKYHRIIRACCIKSSTSKVAGAWSSQESSRPQGSLLT
jgi:hypothetical protein